MALKQEDKPIIKGIIKDKVIITKETTAIETLIVKDMEYRAIIIIVDIMVDIEEENLIMVVMVVANSVD